MIGVIVNSVAIILGSLIGVIFKKHLPDKVAKAVMQVMGLASVFIGIKGSLQGENALITIIALALGTVIGNLIDIEKYIEKFGALLKEIFVKDKTDSNAAFVDAFVSSSVIFGVGAMAIMGSIEAGIKHDYTIFFIKSTMDFVSAIMFSASMGIGVAFSSISIFILQGGMTVLSTFIEPYVNNVSLMSEIYCVGNLLIVAIGLNLLGVTKLKIANMIPAIVLVPIVYYVMMLIH